MARTAIRLHYQAIQGDKQAMNRFENEMYQPLEPLPFSNPVVKIPAGGEVWELKPRVKGERGKLRKRDGGE